VRSPDLIPGSIYCSCKSLPI